MSLPAEVRIVGPQPLRGKLRVPGDKSISHRALVFGALAEGRTRLTRLADGDDVHRTRLALEHLGVRIHTGRGGEVTVGGAGFEGLREPAQVLDCGNSGTTMRLAAGLVAGRPFLSVLTGDATLIRRPMRRVVDPLRRMGAQVDGRDDGALAPLVVRGSALSGAHVELAVASAQVKTALVLAGLQADGTTEIVEPGASRDHTERMLAALGAPVERRGAHTVRVTAGHPAPFELEVPGDPSSAAFFVVGACVSPGSSIVLEDVSINPTRIGFVDVLRRMGARIQIRATGERLGEPVGDLLVATSELESTVVEGDEIPTVIDEIPALAVAAAFADGVTEFRDAGELRVKESDRIATLEQELSQLGIGVETQADALIVRGGRARAGMLKSHGDHRIAMAAAIAANAIDGESVVRGWRAAGSSYPGFVTDLDALRDGGAVGA